MNFLSPAELNMMQAGIVDLLNGPDATDIVLTWKEGGSAPDAVYGDRTGETIASETVRGVVVFPVGGMLLYKSRDIERRKLGEVPGADVIFMLDTEAPLTGKRDLVFSVSGLGEYRMLLEPPLELRQYAVLFPEGEALCQWCFAKAVK